MLVAAAVCPHPPLIVPELAGAAAPELDALRTACAAAIRSLVWAEPDLLVVVGGASESAAYPADASGTLRPWGVDVRVGPGEPVLPLSLTIGRWLLDNAALSSGSVAPGSAPTPFGGPDLSEPVRPKPGRPARGGFGRELGADGFEAVAFDADPAECAALGRRIAMSADRVAMLAMGDGSARLTEKSPGYLHPLALPYNEMLVDAIASAATDRLADLDPAQAAHLWVAGRAAFQVMAAAAMAGRDSARICGPGRESEGVGGTGTGAPERLSGELLYDEAPYGVGYVVAQWGVQ